MQSHDSSSYYFLQALEKSKELSDTLLQMKSLNGVSTVFANLYQFDKAVAYAQQALFLSRIKKKQTA
ncbi:MAG: hypothetical protein IPJ32_13695 [Sphingobacteriaceae bacterium]|nr:hypothetical protein [Sphingobacteriaceae bacterium]